MDIIKTFNIKGGLVNCGIIKFLGYDYASKVLFFVYSFLLFFVPPGWYTPPKEDG